GGGTSARTTKASTRPRCGPSPTPSPRAPAARGCPHRAADVRIRWRTGPIVDASRLPCDPLTMSAPPFDPQELFPHLQAVARALVQSTPEHFRTAFCRVTQAPMHAGGRLEYRIGSEDHPTEGTERPSPELHEAAYEVYGFYRKHGLGFPGLEVAIAAQP